MSVIHTPKKPELDLRMLAFPCVMGTLLLILFSRLWYFQVVKAPELVERAEFSRTIEVTSPAPRGLIFDRNGDLVAGVKPEIVITAVPEIVDKNPWVIEKIAKILNVDPQKLENKVDDAGWRPFMPSPIYVGATIKAGTIISESRDELPGINVDFQPMRYYPDSTSFTHLLGYVWTANDKDTKRITALGVKPANYVGKTGIERSFETDLMGQPGSEKQEIDAKRRPVRIAERNTPNPGNQLVLTIDSRLQKFATKYMADNHYVGGVVALDPKTGEVLCLVSSPTFDQNLFSSGISKRDLNVLNDPANNKPAINRATQSSYSPGSTFKIITSLAAYETHKFDPDTRYYCAGEFRLGRGTVKCLGYHSSIGYYDAMAKSCNSYFCQLGLAVGEDALRKASLEVGFGDKTGIEIGEYKGTVPTRDWLDDRGYKWYAGDTLNFSIGQGYVAATPLQLANLAALVANSGTSFRPHLVREVRSADGKTLDKKITPEVLHHVDASADFWADLHHALIGVLDHGTASYFGKIPGVIWAGKTGSVETGNKEELTHAVFVGYAPADDPKIAICVLIEKSGHGGDKAAPPARDIVETYLKEITAKDKPSLTAGSTNRSAASSVQ